MALISGFLNQLNQIVNLVEHVPTSNITSSHPNGRIFSFFYKFYKIDPYPVIICTGVYPDGRISGLNLHYLPYPIFSKLLITYGDNQAFNYQVIKNQPIIKQAFRSYKLYGITNARKINYKSILSSLSVIRNYSTQEVLNLQNAVNQKILDRQPEILNELFSNSIQNIIQNNIRLT